MQWHKSREFHFCWKNTIVPSIHFWGVSKEEENGQPHLQFLIKICGILSCIATVVCRSSIPFLPYMMENFWRVLSYCCRIKKLKALEDKIPYKTEVAFAKFSDKIYILSIKKIGLYGPSLMVNWRRLTYNFNFKVFLHEYLRRKTIGLSDLLININNTIDINNISDTIDLIKFVSGTSLTP